MKKEELPILNPIQSVQFQYDPIDRLLQNMHNIDSFVSTMAQNPKNLGYANSHLPAILQLRRAMNRQIESLKEEPYHYTRFQLRALHQDVEQIFLYLEGSVGSLKPLHREELRKMIKATKQAISRLDCDLTPGF